MKRKTIRYTDEPIRSRRVKDFLPKPEELILREEQVKVTLNLSKRSLDFFKEQADKSHTGYQAMIRNLLDKYTEHYSA